MSDKLKSSLEDCFQNLPDPRVEGRCDHKLMDMVVIAVCGVICGADSWTGIETVWQSETELVKYIFGIEKRDTLP